MKVLEKKKLKRRGSSRRKSRGDNKGPKITKEMVALLRRVEANLKISLAQEKDTRERLREERLLALE